jgi:HEAT repeat protein
VLTDLRRDLALLQLERVPRRAAILPLSRDSAPAGERLHFIGVSTGRRDPFDGKLWQFRSAEVRKVLHRTHSHHGQRFVGNTVELRSTDLADTGSPVVNQRGALAALVSGSEEGSRSDSMCTDIREIRHVIREHYRSLKKKWEDTAPPKLADFQELPKLIEALKSASADDRLRAAKKLGDLGWEAQSAVPALLLAWKDAGAGLAQQLDISLDRIGPPAVAGIDALLAALESDRPRCRLYAVRSLARMGPDARNALPNLLGCCKDSDPDVRFACLHALPRLGDAGKDTVVKALATALGDPEPRIRKEAAIGLRKIGKPAWKDAFAPLLAALADSDDKVAREVDNTLSALGPVTADDVPVLAKALKSDSVRVRGFAAWSLGFLGPRAGPAKKELTGAVQDSDRQIRLAALDTLRQLGKESSSALPVLLKALGDNDTDIRALAVAALGAVGQEPGVYPALLAALKDPQRKVRIAVDVALHALGGPHKNDAAAIGKCLDSDDSMVRAHAARALGAMGPDGKAAVADLRRALADRSLRVRITAAYALGKIGSASREAVPTLAGALTETIPNSAFDVPAGAPIKTGDRVSGDLLRSAAWVVADRGFSVNGFGSGWVVDSVNPLVMTSYQVVRSARSIMVYFPGEQRGELLRRPADYLAGSGRLGFAGTVVASDPARDLALIRLQRLPYNIEALTLAQRCAVASEAVHSIGNSSSERRAEQGNLWVATNSRARKIAPRDFLSDYRKRVSVRVLETESPINPGDSGGPVVNDQMELVGVVSNLDARDRLVNVAIEVSEVRAMLDGYRKTSRIPLTEVREDRLTTMYPTRDKYRKVVCRALERILQGGRPLDFKEEKVVLAGLRQTLQDGDSQVRLRAPSAIASVGSGGIPPLVVCLADSDPLLRNAALAALEKIDRKWASNAGVKEAVGELIERLKSSDRDVRQAAAETLGKLGPVAKEALYDLREREKNDIAQSVREAARKARRQIDVD